ncbi:YitT family protein [[Mycoplasma] collis]|uniref:YitT family protein n=1 Tax=[Mycoplasma] collis TaxID=2127 RepID=UPI00051B9B03|nr:YitT family protein [[Mycoplasma] collis]
MKFKKNFNYEFSDYNDNFLVTLKKRPIKILMIFISAFLFAFAINIILAKSKTIPTGLTSLPTIIVYIVPETKPYFGLMFFGFNIPLIIIFWNKIKKKIIYLSILWIFFQNIFNLIFTLIPELTNWLNDHFSVSKEFDEMGVDEALRQNKNIWPIIYYTFIGSTIVGLSLGIAWKQGATSGGTDFISYYYSRKKQKSVNKVIMLISLLIFVFSFILLIIFTKIDLGDTKIYKFFGIQAFSTITYIFVNSYFLNIIYPKYKKVEIDIYTTEPVKIIDYFKKINYWHSYNLWTGFSGYTGKKIYKIKTICLYLESNWLLSEIYKIDSKIWVSFKNIQKIKGNFNTSRVD